MPDGCCSSGRGGKGGRDAVLVPPGPDWELWSLAARTHTAPRQPCDGEQGAGVQERAAAPGQETGRPVPPFSSAAAGENTRASEPMSASASISIISSEISQVYQFSFNANWNCRGSCEP